MVCTYTWHEPGMVLLVKRELLGVYCIWKMCVFIVTSVLLHSRLTFKMYFPHDPKGIQ